MLIKSDGVYVYAKNYRNRSRWVIDRSLAGLFELNPTDSINISRNDYDRDAELAFRDAYLETFRHIENGLIPSKPVHEALNFVQEGERQAELARDKVKQSTRVRLPEYRPKQPGNYAWAPGYRAKWSKARGTRHAWAYVRQAWEFLETGRHQWVPEFSPGFESYRILYVLLPRWLEAIEAWHSNDAVAPPPSLRLFG